MVSKLRIESKDMKRITILGASGSIGLSTLDVVRRNRESMEVVALSGHRNVARILEQCQEFRPQVAAMGDPAAAGELRAGLKDAGLEGIEVLSGEDGLEDIARIPEADVVVAAIVGAAGLLPTLAAARSGKRILLANKEALVMSGGLFMREVRQHGAELLPIDSEHNAIFQCLPGRMAGLTEMGVNRILLTASGGPFRERSRTELELVTPSEACAHPNWSMGQKISVDSATLMNKGLELIEACWLFDADPDDVEVVVHPQSIIHSMVSYIDGSVLAQMGNPDMRTPIAHALAWPERIDAGVAPLDIVSAARLDFERPDTARFPCLRLASEAMKQGGTATAVLNAANEVAVAAFLEGEIAFLDIPATIEAALEGSEIGSARDLETILQADESARREARSWINTRR